MSLRLRLLNAILPYTERRFLEKETDPKKVRNSFDFKARLLFRAPRGTQSNEISLANVPCLRVHSNLTKPPATLFFIHGGGYIFGNAQSYEGLAARLGLAAGIYVVLPDYRLAPEHAFPAAVDDVIAAYRALCIKHPNRKIILGGDSAGGGLALAVLAATLAAGLPKPALTVLLSPFTDMTYSGASVQENAAKEVLLPVSRIYDLQEMYLQGADPTDLRASPLWADFTGSGPVAIYVGTTEILRDDSTRLAKKLSAQGVEVDLFLRPNAPHVWPFMAPILPEGRQDITRIGAQIRAVL